MSNFINELLTKVIKDQVVKATSENLNVSELLSKKAISAAIPLLIGGLVENTFSNKKVKSLAGALDKKHDGSLLKDVLGQLSKQSVQKDGSKIVDHIFDGNVDFPAEVIEKLSVIKPGQGKQILSLLAPVVMAALGKQKSKENLSFGDLPKLLNEASSEVGNDQSLIKKLLTQSLDKDGDGQVIDDIAENLMGQVMKNFFG